MDSFNLSLSEEDDEDLQDNLLRIANGMDNSDLDSSNTPTEAPDETEQGQAQGSVNLNNEPINISDESDDSDNEEDTDISATIPLKPARGQYVKINRYVSAGIL